MLKKAILLKGWRIEMDTPVKNLCVGFGPELE
jgi:hypothetical protein